MLICGCFKCVILCRICGIGESVHGRVSRMRCNQVGGGIRRPLFACSRVVALAKTNAFLSMLSSQSIDNFHWKLCFDFYFTSFFGSHTISCCLSQGQVAWNRIY